MSAASMHAVAAVAAALTAFSSQSVAQISVGPPGSGATYQQIHAALAVASVGETIFVLPGQYEPFDVTQGVSIVGAGAASTEVAIELGSADGAIDVTQLPAGQFVRISGLSVARTSGSTDARIHVADCDGRVELVAVNVEAIMWPAQSFVDEASILIENCSSVHLDACLVQGCYPPGQNPWMAGSEAVRAVDSSVYINECTLQGASGSEGYGGPALQLSTSYAKVARSRLTGGGGGAHVGFYWWDIYGFSGEEAIDLFGSDLVMSGGPGNEAVGGEGSFIDAAGGGPAVRLDATSSLRYASDVVLTQGLSGDGIQYNYPIQNIGLAGLVVAETEARNTLACVPAGAMPGDVVDVQAAGEANALHITFAALDGVTPIPVGGDMHAHIDPTQSGVLAFIQLDGTGFGSFPVALPSSAALAGASLVLQSIDADLSTIRLSNAAMITVLLP